MKKKNILPKPKPGQRYVEKEFINGELKAERTIEYLHTNGIDYVFKVVKGEKGTACYTPSNWVVENRYEISKKTIVCITLENAK